MTARLNRSPQQPPERLTHRAGATRDDSPRVAGPVPITVWRLDDHDEGAPTTEPRAGFASRLARRLILVYTRHGDTVVDFDHDHHLRVAATAAGRAYLALTEPDGLPRPGEMRNPAGLLTLHWPRETSPSTVDQIGALLAACRPIMAKDASVIAAVRPGHSAEAGGTFADHEHALRATAEIAGLTHAIQIVAISAPGEGDQFLYYATQTEAVHAARQAATTPDQRALHIDLLVLRQGSRDG